MATHDALIRDLLLSSGKGPLRVQVGPGGYPPWLRAGETAWIERRGAEALRGGDLVGIRRTGEQEVRLYRFLERRDGRVRLLAPARVLEAGPAELVGRVAEVARDGRRVAVDATARPAELALEVLEVRLRALGRRARLKAQLGSLYWGLVDRFEHGVSETGDLLVTERCPVGCRFCIYSCVTQGQDMDAAVVARAARAFRVAGVPLVRLLGGEPFLLLPHLVRCWRAVREHYPADRIVILTSGYFGTGEDLVRAKLDPLAAEGLSQLHLSFDLFHLERYPIDCYRRVLDYCSARGIETTLVIHYSDGLERLLGELVDLHRRHGFAVRLSTVSREGDAAGLSQAETEVGGFDAFRARLLVVPGLKLIPEERSCFRWTVFPSGEVNFCCKEGAKNRAGNLAREDFPAIQARLRRHSARNRLNVLRFVTGHSGEVSGNPCLTCPLEAEAATAVSG